mgnify:FL=1
MPSSSKTNYLQLNYWSAGDKPKMADFNNDNQRLDNAFQSHVQNNAQHLTGNQSAWLAQPFVSGTYTGDGAASRSVTLGFAPALLVILPEGYGPLELDTVQETPLLRFALAADGCGSTGVTLTATGFTVNQAQSIPLAGLAKTCLNEQKVVYRYFAIRPAG